MNSKSKQEANRDAFFGANGGNAVQIGMRIHRLPQYTPPRLSTIDCADLAPRKVRASALMQLKPGYDPAEACDA
jgi:hypothetical protein